MVLGPIAAVFQAILPKRSKMRFSCNWSIFPKVFILPRVVTQAREEAVFFGLPKGF